MGGEDAASTDREVLPEFRDSMSLGSSGFSHTSPSQFTGSHDFSITTLTVKVDVLCGSEFNLCCNTASHRMRVCFWFQQSQSSGDKGDLQGIQRSFPVICAALELEIPMLKLMLFLHCFSELH